MNSKHEVSIDYIKIFACILVAVGHFFQSMVKSSVLPNSSLYQWFNTTIYYFHVPLFFICSGYLYQKYSRIDSFSSWGNNILKKAIILGVPYFVFSLATWLLKTVFSADVNDQIGGLGYVLFVQPTAPYWYLYILFLVFVVVPTVKTKKRMGALLGIAIFGKILNITGGGGSRILHIYAVSVLLSYLIWFVLGMAVAFGDLKKQFSRTGGIIFGIVFLLVSLWSYRVDNAFLSFGMGLLACTAVFMMINDCKEVKFLNWFAKYTMPIFLMHTLFAAPCRILLIKLGVTNAAIQVGLGIAISFIGPIAAMMILEKIKLDFLVYPGRLIKN